MTGYTPSVPEAFVKVWSGVGKLCADHWGAVLLVLAVWTVVALYLVAKYCDRQWFRRIALTTAVVNVVALINTNGLEKLGAIIGAGSPGWLIACVLFVIHYRWLERVNARMTLPDIVVEKVVDESGVWQAGLEALLRDSINRASPHSPSRYPGGGVEYLSDFAKMASESSWWPAKFASYFFRLAFPPRALKVSGALVSAKPERREAAGISVAVEDAVTGAVVMSCTVRARNLQDAVEQAAYRVADYAIQNCPTLPRWAYWSEEHESTAFLEYWRGVRERKHTVKSLKRAERHLDEAARQSQSSVLPRLQLAAVLEAQQRYVDAIEIYANVAGRFELLFDARYRLASLLRKAGSVSEDLCTDYDKQRRLAQAFESPVRGMSTHRVPVRKVGQGSDEYWRSLRSYLLDEASSIQDQLAQDFSWWRMVWWSVRHTADRRYLTPRYLRTGERRKAARAAMRTAGFCTQLVKLQMQYAGNGGPPQKEIRAIESAALRALGKRNDERKRAEKGWWGIPHYNLACFYALQLRSASHEASCSATRAEEEHNVQNAVQHLAIAAMDPHGPFGVDSLWWTTLEYDREFEHLRAHERFRNWAGRNLLAVRARARGAIPSPQTAANVAEA